MLTEEKQRAAWDRLKRELRDMRLDEAQKTMMAIDWRATIQLALDKDDWEASNAVSMSVELLDYLGHFNEARERIRPLADHVDPRLRQLRREDYVAPRDLNERRRLKSDVWVLFHQGMAYYRLQHYSRARDLFELGEWACLQSLKFGDEFSYKSTLARLYYGFGLIYREQYAYRTAQDYFLRSIELTSSESRMAPNPSNRARGHSLWTDLASCRALAFGLGYIHHDLGQPALALPLLLMARAILSRAGETLVSGLVELIYYNTVRSAYGDDPVRLDEAIEGLKRCFSAFTERQHQLYEMRAAHSLALALTQRARQIAISRSALERGDLNEAQQYCQLAERRAVQLKDFKLQCLLLVCRSRIERKRGHFEKAQELATRALKTVGEDFLLIRVRALTARAEASSSLGRYESALQDLLLCDSSTAQVSNPRLRAVALLRCAQIYATTGQSRQASETFEKYLSIKDSVVNAEVRQSESQVRTELARVAEGRDFVVRMIDDNLDPHTIERRLHIFLAEWARSRSASDREAAQQLGVSRQTLLNWSSEKGTRGEFLPGKNRRLRKL